MVPHHDLVVALVVIVPEVVFALQGSFNFLASLADVEDLRVVQDFLELKGSQVLFQVLDCLCRGERELEVI